MCLENKGGEVTWCKDRMAAMLTQFQILEFMSSVLLQYQPFPVLFEFI